MIKHLRTLFATLSRTRRLQLGALVLLIVAGSFAEMVSISAVVPLLTILAQPNANAHSIFSRLPIGSGNNVALTIVLLFSFAVLVAAALRLLLHWFGIHLSFQIGIDLTSRIYRSTLYQPFKYHLSNNSSTTIAALNKVQSVIGGLLMPLVQGFAALVFVIAIVATLILIDPFVALITLCSCAVLYGLAAYLTSGKLRSYSAKLSQSEGLRIQAIQEGLGGIREVTIDSSQEFFVARYLTFEMALRSAQASINLVSVIPRYVVEAIGMSGIVFLAYYLSQRDGDLVAALPTLGALAIGAQRLLPQAQQLYNAWSSVRGTTAPLNDVLELLRLEEVRHESLPVADTPRTPIWELRHLGFAYDVDRPVLTDINLKIKKGAFVGLTGPTGCGKSTLINLMMGLITPSSGEVLISGNTLTSTNARALWDRLAHVPQTVFLADTSIAQNIAFGRPVELIDLGRVEKAAKIAQLDAFVRELPDRYETSVGERGIRLSGGQRQRIGIARALYKGVDILVLDEATSALDQATEAVVIEQIRRAQPLTTIVMITHRLTTIRYCDEVFELSGGRMNGREVPAISFAYQAGAGADADRSDAGTC